MFGAIVLAALVKLLVETENPLLCALFYTALALIGALLALTTGTVSVFGIVLSLIAAFALSLAYFWILNRLEPVTPVWWVVLIGGPAVVYFL